MNLFLIGLLCLIFVIIVSTSLTLKNNSNTVSNDTAKNNQSDTMTNHDVCLNNDDKEKLHTRHIPSAEYEMGNYNQSTNHYCYMYKDYMSAVPSDMNRNY